MTTIPKEAAAHINEYFNRVFVLSIERFTDRHAAIKKNLDGLKYEFFWGVDKQLLDIENLKASGVYDEKKAMALNRRNKTLNLGEIVCSLSHRKLYAYQIEASIDRVLIFEDDTVPNSKALLELPETLKELPPDWDLVYFGYLKHETVTGSLKIKQIFYRILSSLGLMKWKVGMVNRILPKPFSKHLKVAGFHDCTHAYALSLRGAKKLMEAQDPVVFASDNLLSYCVLKGSVKAFVTQPKFFDQEWFTNPDAVSVKTE